MKLQHQTRFGGADDPPDKQGNCFPTCLACILDLPVDEVPVFHGVEWLVQCQEWLGSKGLFLMTFEEDPYKEEPRLQQGVTFIASGPGPRGHRHSVLWRNGKLLHDPHPSGDGLVGYPEEFEVLVVTDMYLFRDCI